MKILITGATGFIGSNLVNKLVEKYDIVVLGRVNSNFSKLSKKVKFYKYDGNLDLLLEFFYKEQFDGVIHLASLFLSSHNLNDVPNLISSNIKFGTEILEACKASKVNWFLNTGTFWQHYNNEEYNPVNLYAATKEAFEKIAKYYTETSDLIFTTLKLNDTFGVGDTRKKIFNLWGNAIKLGAHLDMTEGKQIVNFIYIEDVVSAYEILVESLCSKDADKLKNKKFCIRAKEQMTLRKLAQIFQKVSKGKLKINWGKRDYRIREVMEPWDKGEIVPNWQPKYKMEEAIKKTIESFTNGN